LKAQRQISCTSTIGKKTKVSDAKETFGEQMKEKATQKLVYRNCHGSSPVFVRGVSPAEGDLVVGHGNKTLIGNGDPVRVSAEVTQDMFRTAERSFAVNNPVLLEQLPEERGESSR